MTEIVKSLFESLDDINGSPMNMMTVAEFERILRTLNQYVSIIRIDYKGRVGIVDVDSSVNAMRNNVERMGM